MYVGILLPTRALPFFSACLDRFHNPIDAAHEACARLDVVVAFEEALEMIGVMVDSTELDQYMIDMETDLYHKYYYIIGDRFVAARAAQVSMNAKISKMFRQIEVVVMVQSIVEIIETLEMLSFSGYGCAQCFQSVDDRLVIDVQHSFSPVGSLEVDYPFGLLESRR